jgi:hypothetical protein
VGEELVREGDDELERTDLDNLGQDFGAGDKALRAGKKARLASGSVAERARPREGAYLVVQVLNPERILWQHILLLDLSLQRALQLSPLGLCLVPADGAVLSRGSSLNK